MYQGNSDPKQMFLFSPSQSLSRSSKTLKREREGGREIEKVLKGYRQQHNQQTHTHTKHNKLSSSNSG